MTTTLSPQISKFEARSVIARAVKAGFRLEQYETDSGQTVWEWRRGDEPRPQFVTQRVALHWMTEFISRDVGLAFALDAGQGDSPNEQ